MKIKNIIPLFLILTTICIIMPTTFACGPDGLDVEITDNNITCVNGTSEIHLYSSQGTVNDGTVEILIENTCMAKGNVINNTARIIKQENTICPPAGTYNATANYIGSYSFQDISKQITVYVPEELTETNIIEDQITCENGQTTIHIESKDGSIINEGYIQIYIADTCMAKGNVVNGIAIIKQSSNVSTCPAGKYNGTAVYSGTNKYAQTSKNLIITVPEHMDLIKAEINDNILISTNNTVTIHIEAENKNIIDCGIIRLYQNDKLLGSDTVTDNQITIKNLGLKAGTYNITATYNCNDNHYTNTTKNLTLFISDTNKTITKITCDNFTENYGDGLYYTGYLTDLNNKPIIGEYVQLKLSRTTYNQSKIYTTVTDYTGKYQLQINLAPGTYKIEAKYEGRDKYAPVESETAFIIVTDNRTDTKINTNNIEKNKSSDKKFTGTLTYKNILLNNKQINLEIIKTSNNANKIYTLETNNNGEFSIDINLASGRYLIKTSFNGDTIYKPSNAENTLLIFNL